MTRPAWTKSECTWPRSDRSDAPGLVTNWENQARRPERRINRYAPGVGEGGRHGTFFFLQKVQG